MNETVPKATATFLKILLWTVCLVFVTQVLTAISKTATGANPVERTIPRYNLKPHREPKPENA